MKEHTPGPWYLATYTDHKPGVDRGDWCGEIYSKEGKIYHGPFSSHSIPIEANARLMAAAPDLLAACEACVVAHDAITEGEMNGYGACRFCGTLEYPVDEDGEKCEAEDAAEWRADHDATCVSTILDALSVFLRAAIAKAHAHE